MNHPQSKAESLWKMFGKEYRKIYKQGTGAARTARRFTRKMLNKARRAFGKKEIQRGLEE